MRVSLQLNSGRIWIGKRTDWWPMLLRGYQVPQIVKEIGSGVNDNRSKFLALLADQSVSRIVIEHKERGTRFGFRYIETLLLAMGREIEVVNTAENGTE